MVENITIIKGTDGPTAVFWREKIIDIRSDRK